MKDKILAVAITYDPDTGETFATPFEDTGAVEKAWGFIAGIKDDWPGCIHGVVANKAAGDDNGERLIKRYGLDE